MDAGALLRTLGPERARFVRVARLRVATRADAEDVVDHALLRAAERAGTLAAPARALPWFYRILRRSIVDLHRRRSNDPLRAGAANDPEVVALEVGEAGGRGCPCALELLAGLRAPYQTLLRRVDLEGQDPRAVAHELGLTENNLHVRLHRARRALRQALERRCGVASCGPCLDCTCDDSGRTYCAP